MNYSNYQKLRNLVLLGLEHFNWFEQKTFEGQSREFLKYAFPRTFEKATLNLAIQIACIEHDKNIQGNKIHLFRFPHSDERELSFYNLDSINSDILEGLNELAAGISIETKPGPVHIGTVTELNEDCILQSFAKQYLEAFKNNYKTYPYLT